MLNLCYINGVKRIKLRTTAAVWMELLWQFCEFLVHSSVEIYGFFYFCLIWKKRYGDFQCHVINLRGRVEPI